MKKIYNVLHLFCGIGGGAIGFQRAKNKYRELEGCFNTLTGIDNDEEACVDFERLTGARATKMDLFSREDYIAFYDNEPPVDWKEVLPEDIYKACNGITPDVVFTSAPCKGFSGLLPEKSAKSAKYKALNNLTVRGLWLTLEAFSHDPPSIILFENVPRIKSRGKKELNTIIGLLKSYGYAVSLDDHDCGEIGALGQKRLRFLLIARNPAKVSSFVYEPVKHKHKTIGDIIGPLPLPGDIENGGPMHRIPKLQWKTWVRLALIPAGGDWRDLEKVDWQKYKLEHTPRSGVFQVARWDKPSGTIIGNAKVQGSNGVAAVADPRLNPKSPKFNHAYKLSPWDDSAGTVSGGTGPSSGAHCINDPRTGFKDGTHASIYRVSKWDDTGPTVTGAMRPNNGAISIQDPGLGCSPRNGSYGVQEWGETGKTVTGSGDVHAGSSAIADPRIPEDTESGTWIIIAEDGTWHRPLTTFELAMLQSFPMYMPDGKPFQLTGNSDARWRERIGNAVPPAAAEAMANVILRALLLSEYDSFELSLTPIWVNPLNDNFDKIKELS